MPFSIIFADLPSLHTPSFNFYAMTRVLKAIYRSVKRECAVHIIITIVASYIDPHDGSSSSGQAKELHEVKWSRLIFSGQNS